MNSAISVSVDNGFLRVIGEISIGGSKKEKEAFVSEIQWNLLGDHKELPPNALLRSAFTRALRGRRRNLHRTLKIVFVQLPPRREKASVREDRSIRAPASVRYAIPSTNSTSGWPIANGTRRAAKNRKMSRTITRRQTVCCGIFRLYTTD